MKRKDTCNCVHRGIIIVGLLGSSVLSMKISNEGTDIIITVYRVLTLNPMVHSTLWLNLVLSLAFHMVPKHGQKKFVSTEPGVLS